MSTDYAACSDLLISAFKKSKQIIVYYPSVVNPTDSICKAEPDFLKMWRDNPDKLKFSDFLDECLRVSKDLRLGCMYGTDVNKGIVYYYDSNEEPPSQLLEAVARCLIDVLDGKWMTLNEIRRHSGLMNILDKLSVHYGNDDRKLVQALKNIRPELTISLPRAQTPIDKPIPGYPLNAWAQMGKTESRDEIDHLEEKVDDSNFDNCATQLRSLTGYEGKDVNSWLAIFAHDWGQGIIKSNDEHGWWRSTRLCDASGRQLFALMNRDKATDKWHIVHFCSADEFQRETGLSEARPPRPFYHTYDLISYELHQVIGKKNGILKSNVLNSMKTHVEQGREPLQSDLIKLQEYYKSWEEVRNTVTGDGISKELGISLNEASADEILDQIQKAMQTSDVKDEWIDVLSQVVKETWATFESALELDTLGFHIDFPLLETDLQEIAVASSHYEQMRDQLAEIGNYYIMMVSTLRNAERYEDCGESLHKIEERLGGSLQNHFNKLCEKFRDSEIPVQRLERIQKRALDNTAAKPLAVEARESIEVEGRPFSRDGLTSMRSIRISEIRHSEEPLKPAEPLPEAAPQLQPITPMTQERSAYDKLNYLKEGYKGFYEAGVDQGHVLSVVSVTGYSGRLLLENKYQAKSTLDDFLFGTVSRSIDDFLLFVNVALADKVRPATLFRVFGAFDEPNLGLLEPEKAINYLLVRMTCERLHACEEVVDFDYLESYATELVDMQENLKALNREESCALAETGLFLVTQRPNGNTLKLFSRICGLLGSIGSELKPKVDKICELAQDCYLTGSNLVGELNRGQSERELAIIRSSASKYEAGTFNSQYSSASFLWNWLVAQDGSESYGRLRNMLDSLAGKRDEYDAQWRFEDKSDAEEYLDDCTAKQEREGGRPKELMVGSPREKFVRRLMEVSSKFDQFCELRSYQRGSSRYLDPVYRELSSQLLAIHSDLLNFASDVTGIYGTIAQALLSRYPANELPWDEDGPFEIGSESALLSQEELSFAEFQEHRVQNKSARISLPREDDISLTLSKGETAYFNNVIGPHERELLRTVLAGMLGAIKYYRDHPLDTLSARMAFWSYEGEEYRLDADYKKAIDEFRESIKQKLAQPGLANTARKEWLNKILERINNGDADKAVLAYGDFLVDTNAIVPVRPAAEADDILYGNGSDVSAKYDSIRNDLINQSGFYPTVAISGIPGDIQSAEIPKMRNCLKNMSSLIEKNPIPINRETKAISPFLSDFEQQLLALFTQLGFRNAAVKHEVEPDGNVRSFRLDFLSVPGECIATGSPVCPLGQLTSIDRSDCAQRTNASIIIKIFTSYNSLYAAARIRDENVDGRVIALYLGNDKDNDNRYLKLDDRIALARSIFSYENGAGFLLVDWVLCAYLLHWELGENQRIGAFFRCASQFTHLHPYVDKGLPNAARLLPPSEEAAPFEQPPLFYGRGVAIKKIRSFDSSGVHLVYGARRMGKTSILREVEAILTAERVSGSGSDIAAYCDLRGYSGGSVDDFWVKYVARAFEQLVPNQIFGLGNAICASTVQTALLDHIRENKVRLIILLDEADDMIRQDSFPRGSDGTQDEILNSLYKFEKMTSANFKFVLCGLHVTMRYSAVINSVQAHFGTPLVITPLWEGGGYTEAYRLVYEPMKAMGVRLSHEIILTIIKRVGYYPNLINQICEKLLDTVRLRTNLWESSHGPYVLGDSVVESVFSDYDARLRRNFDDTIALDPAYGVVINAVALLGIRTGWGPVSVKDIMPVISEVREKIRSHSSSPFRIEDYLSELERFRVLRSETVSSGKGYLVRDPEIREMFKDHGEADAFDRLSDAVKKWDTSNADEFHPELSRDTMSWPDCGPRVLSSLNHIQMSRVDNQLKHFGLCIITGSDEFLLGTFVTEFLHRPGLLSGSLANRETIQIQRVESAIPEISNPSGAVVAVVGEWDEQDISRAIAQIKENPELCYIFIAGPETAWRLRDLLNGDERAKVVPMTPWEPINVSQWLKYLLGSAYSQNIYQEFLSHTDGIPAICLSSANNNLSYVHTLTDDLSAVLGAQPAVGKLISEMAQAGTSVDGSNDFLSAADWIELLNSDFDIKEYCSIMAWLIAMGMAARSDDSSGDSIVSSTPIRLYGWVVAALGSAPDVAGGELK